MSLSSVNPATGQVLATYPFMDATDLEARLAAAAAGFRAWRGTPVDVRASALRAIADLLEADKHRLGRTIVSEMGKPLAAAVGEVEKCAATCRFYAEHGPGQLAAEDASYGQVRASVRFLPLGPILAIMPWNFPLFQVIRFLAPTLMAGNVALLKHAENVPQSALAIEAIASRAGLPAGVFQSLFVPHEAVPAIIADPRVAAVTLTGSERAGAAVAAEAGRALKKCVLELGGSDPWIVMPSADAEAAARAGLKARLFNNGQSCICAKRFIVADPVYDRFTDAMVSAAKAVRIGDPMTESTELGPLVSDRARDTLHRQVLQAEAEGARVLAGGRLPEGPGFFYPPTVLADLPEGSAARREELFGPVAILLRARGRDHALALANESPFGLGSSVWTRDADDADFFATGIEAGMTFINSPVASDPHLPFGGIKRSGFGREFGTYGLREFTNIKTVVLA